MKKLYAINNVLFLIFMLIAIPSIFMSEFGSNIRFGKTKHHEEIISASKAEELLKDNKRKSLISFQEMILVDSSKMVFIIPISQKKLKKTQKIEVSTDFYEIVPGNKVDALISDIPENIVSIPKSLVYGIYNNIILYSQYPDFEHAIFDRRVSIS